MLLWYYTGQEGKCMNCATYTGQLADGFESWLGRIDFGGSGEEVGVGEEGGWQGEAMAHYQGESEHPAAWSNICAPLRVQCRSRSVLTMSSGLITWWSNTKVREQISPQPISWIFKMMKKKYKFRMSVQNAVHFFVVRMKYKCMWFKCRKYVSFFVPV